MNTSNEMQYIYVMLVFFNFSGSGHHLEGCSREERSPPHPEIPTSCIWCLEAGRWGPPYFLLRGNTSQWCETNGDDRTTAGVTGKGRNVMGTSHASHMHISFYRPVRCLSILASEDADNWVDNNCSLSWIFMYFVTNIINVFYLFDRFLMRMPLQSWPLPWLVICSHLPQHWGSV